MLLRLGLEFRRLTLLASDDLAIHPAMGWAALSPAGEGAEVVARRAGCLVSRGRGCRASPPRSRPPPDLPSARMGPCPSSLLSGLG